MLKRCERCPRPLWGYGLYKLRLAGGSWHRPRCLGGDSLSRQPFCALSRVAPCSGESDVNTMYLLRGDLWVNQRRGWSINALPYMHCILATSSDSHTNSSLALGALASCTRSSRPGNHFRNSLPELVSRCEGNLLNGACPKHLLNVIHHATPFTVVLDVVQVLGLVKGSFR